eukprot:TRINITY_DN1178_c0_g1_i3.p1 TRINITY_DN1178_c0_g1~~TRINITY_DN1178_c0_g1_i3.p1  ORF type:complete len:583 (+),score=127.11 TRINITY_DN1178_c0_g1_i3:400-2148(+)
MVLDTDEADVQPEPELYPETAVDILPTQEGIDYEGGAFTMVKKDRKKPKTKNSRDKFNKNKLTHPHSTSNSTTSVYNKSKSSQQQQQQRPEDTDKRGGGSRNQSQLQQQRGIDIGPAPPPGAVWQIKADSGPSKLLGALVKDLDDKKAPVLSRTQRPKAKKKERQHLRKKERQQQQSAAGVLVAAAAAVESPIVESTTVPAVPASSKTQRQVNRQKKVQQTTPDGKVWRVKATSPAQLPLSDPQPLPAALSPSTPPKTEPENPVSTASEPQVAPDTANTVELSQDDQVEGAPNAPPSHSITALAPATSLDASTGQDLTHTPAASPNAAASRDRSYRGPSDRRLQPVHYSQQQPHSHHHGHPQVPSYHPPSRQYEDMRHQVPQQQLSGLRGQYRPQDQQQHQPHQPQQPQQHRSEFVSSDARGGRREGADPRSSRPAPTPNTHSPPHPHERDDGVSSVVSDAGPRPTEATQHASPVGHRQAYVDPRLSPSEYGPRGKNSISPIGSRVTSSQAPAGARVAHSSQHQHPQSHSPQQQQQQYQQYYRAGPRPHGPGYRGPVPSYYYPVYMSDAQPRSSLKNPRRSP